MPVPVPSIEDQYAVVKTLNCIKSQLAATQQMLDKLDQLVKSRFVEMFDKGHQRAPMGQLVDSIVAGTNAGGQQRPLADGEYGVLKISAVTKGVFLPNEFKAVEDVSSIKMIHPREGDLLFSRANTSEMVGATAIVDKNYDWLFLPDKLWRARSCRGGETVFLKARYHLRRLGRKCLGFQRAQADQCKISRWQNLESWMPFCPRSLSSGSLPTSSPRSTNRGLSRSSKLKSCKCSTTASPRTIWG